MKRVKVKVRAIQLFPDFGVVITAPCTQNEKGAFRFSINGIIRLAQRLDITVNTLKALVSIPNDDTYFEFDTEYVKKDQTWENTTTGETGVYTKDHWRVQNAEIALGSIANAKIVDMSMRVDEQLRLQAAQSSPYATSNVAASSGASTPRNTNFNEGGSGEDDDDGSTVDDSAIADKKGKGKGKAETPKIG